MFRKLANLEARALRRQADNWEKHPFRTLLIAVAIQTVLQTATRKLRSNTEKSAPAPSDTKTEVHVKYEDLDEDTKNVVRDVLKRVNAPLN